jgi:hypothetical protein
MGNCARQSPTQETAVKQQDPKGQNAGRGWSKDVADELQEAVNGIFGKDSSNSIRGIGFALTIADPLLKGCPLIGCSSGFTSMCGYEMEEIVGRNCRFLVDPVPAHLIDEGMRTRAREFCEVIRSNEKKRIRSRSKESKDSAGSKDKQAEKKPQGAETWTPIGNNDGVFCAQVNMRKDGMLFNNMFYLREIELEDKTFILGLQTVLPDEPGSEYEAHYKWACKRLEHNMAEVERVLSKIFWFSAAMRRQESGDEEGYGDLSPCSTNRPV